MKNIFKWTILILIAGLILGLFPQLWFLVLGGIAVGNHICGKKIQHPN